VQDELARGAEHRLDLHRNGLATAVTGGGEDGQAEHLTVKMHRDVTLHLNGKVLHHLRVRIIMIKCFNIIGFIDEIKKAKMRFLRFH